MLSTEEMTRLIQLLGMMGSDHDGEILNAAKLAQRVLKKHRLQWSEVFNGGQGQAHTQNQGAANRAAEGEAERRGWQTGYAMGQRVGRAETLAEWEWKYKQLEQIIQQHGKELVRNGKAEYAKGLAEGHAKAIREAKAKQEKAKTAAKKAGSGAWKDFAHEMIDDYIDALTSWEQDFFRSFATSVRLSPTEKQYAIFCRVASKLRIELPEQLNFEPQDVPF